MMRLTQAIDRAKAINSNGIASYHEGVSQTWTQFHSRVSRLASAYRKLEIKAGDRVAMLAHNSSRYLEWFFATSWSGGVFVPINTRLAAPEIRYWLNDSGSKVLFVDDFFLPVLKLLEGKLESVNHVVYVGRSKPPKGLHSYEGLITSSSEIDDAGRMGNDIAGLFYTGGTTGISKGVMLSHANLISHALNVIPILKLDSACNSLHVAPMFHLGDGTITFATSLMAGSHSFVPKFDVHSVLQAVEQYRPTHTVLVPTMINMIMNSTDVTHYDLSSLKTILYGASPMPETLLRRAIDILPETNFIHGYGQTEASPLLTFLGPKYHNLSSQLSEKINSIGHPAPSVEIKILDEADKEVQTGKVGQICARAPNVMLGYWNKPSLTEETLRNGWLHTGDGGYIDQDGFLYIVDRIKDMIISGGENVYSAEVENAIYRHPAISECAVIGIPDTKWGERVHAVITLKKGEMVTPEEIIIHCKQLIASYKCPSSVEIRQEPMPISGAGKILKTTLRGNFWYNKP